MACHNDLGKIGERIAAEFLITKGYTIREINWRSGKVEIDVVAEINQRLVIVEVKTRSTDYIDPIRAIDNKKRSNLVRAANAYINYWNINMEVQFDIISIIGNTDNYEMEHIPDAFFPPMKTYRN